MQSSMTPEIPPDKPIRPAVEALRDTWVFPALTAILIGLHWLPGGSDWLLKASTCMAGVMTVSVYLTALKLHQRHRIWQRYADQRIAAWQREQEQQHLEWLWQRYGKQRSQN